MSEELLHEIAEVNGRLDDLEDPRICYAMIQERIQACKKAGEEIPEDLRRLERSLLTECFAESQGR